MLLLKAFKRLCDCNDNLELHLINYQPQNPEAEDYIKSNLRGAKIVFDDLMDNDTIPEFLNKLNIFVMPSRVESFGVAALEASACNLPIVATTVGGIPEVVVDGVTGILFGDNDLDALTDALNRLINNRDLRVKMGAAGRSFVMDNYVWHNNVEELLAHYAEACSQ
jgi:glycosyltransferase involved in cell wall biosynthesis